MKKLLLATCLLVSFPAFSQILFKVTQVDIRKYDSYTKDYEPFQVTNPSNMSLRIEGNIITVTNRTSSNYRTTGQAIKRTMNTYVEHEWSATDEENIKCRFSLIKYNSGRTVAWVTYADLIVIYEIESY